ncbi:hypothetical protein, partial [Catelliglobosispora koreensis]|uniref:hypothetical protein n=1 Tax=Catelliglobosispora koreensis TaxID=129052 RepID=UPI0003648B8C
PASNRLIVSIDDGRAFHWDVLLAATPITRIFSSLGSHMPPGLWRQKWMLTAMSTIAGPVLGAGAITLHGNTPNGHQFEANPARIWYLSHIQVSISGNDLGPTGPLPEQATLGGFRIPQRGIFAIGQSLFEIAA